nr:MAG: hypothetical protein [Bacteriophage sp.]UVN10479.1 MAG: hypothetical protein [Bacteriophage sp.]UVX44253.1 MAG: hypothetical protein [Bacteriophage sp.]UVX46935.1 MAG: hypothetical protein [Bacteriophage sp.]
MVQRYVASYNDYYTHEDGEFVTYEDYVELETAVIALLVDINRRYPGEGFKCPLILKLAEIVGHEPRN